VPSHPPAEPRILVVRFSSMGDIILTTPLLRALRRRYPSAEITALTKRSFAPLLSDHPGLDRLIAWEPGRPLRDLAAELRGYRFSHILDLHGTLRARILRLLVPGNWTGYGKRRVAREILIRTKRNLYRDTVPEPERYFEAARELDVHPDGGPPDFFLSAAAEERGHGWLHAAGLGEQRPLVALVPGAAHATKRWPVESWIELARQLTADGFDAAVLGGPDYAPECAAIAEAGGRHAVSAAGAFGLQETGAVLRRARVSVSGDTGVMHMASATRTPIVALLGPTVGTFGFLPYQAKAIILERSLPCRPCSSQGGPACPLGHHRCLRDIPPQEVAAAVRRMAAA